MSLIYTESFAAFAESVASDAWDSSPGAGNAARENTRLAMIRADYGVVVSANNSKDTSGGFVMRSDPIYPERTALCHSSDVTPGVANQYSAAFRRRLPITSRPIFVGFSIYIPPEYVPNGFSSNVAVLRVNATLASDQDWYQQALAINAAKECFRICNDLSVRWGNDAAQSSRKLTVGALNYMEVRIEATTVAVWIDDVFVMQKSVALIPETIAFCIENNVNSGGSQMIGNAGRWAFGNMYYMFNDGVAPTARLGPTTRVIGQRPDQDIDVRFVRPSAAASNAAVAAQDLIDSPPFQLQSTTVGDFDVYATNDAVSKTSILTMGMVHAVCTKTLAANLEPDVHRIKPFVKSDLGGAEGADVKPKEFVLLTGLPFTRTIRAMGVRPTDKCIFICGDGEMLYRSGPNYDVSVWVKINDTGSPRNYYGMWFRSDGGVLIGANNVGGNPATGGPSSWLPPGSDTLHATAGTATVSPAMGFFAISPDSTKLVGFGVPGNGGMWSGVTLAANYNGATPHAGTWTLTNTNLVPSNANGFASVASKPDNSQHMILQAGPNDNVYINSTAAMTAYLARGHADPGAYYSAVVWDGRAWLIGATVQGGVNGAPRIRRSLDASTFSAISGFGNTLNGPDQQLRCGISNQATFETLFVGDGGAMVMSVDGINWRQLPRVTTASLFAGVVTPTGDFIVGGQNGTMLRTQSVGADTALYPLAGYKMAFGSSVFNPYTATTWTTAEAAEADFGVRLTF